MANEKIPYTVLRDTGEHKGHGWLFDKSESCAGTENCNLFTGDYSLLLRKDGVVVRDFYESRHFVIERKGSVSEFVGNLFNKEKWDDFKDELTRLEEFRHPFIICEFPFSLIETYPVGSGIPRSRWRSIRITPKAIVKRLWEIELHFKTKIHFADLGGKASAESLFKRIVENAAD